MQTNRERYFIEPLLEVRPEPNGRHVHMIYQITPHENLNDPNQTQYCGTDGTYSVVKDSTNYLEPRFFIVQDNWESAWTEQLTRKQQQLAEENDDGEEESASPGGSGTHSVHRYVEIGLIADRKFLDHHEKANHEQYLLTIMNMASDFYHDQSIGNQIDLIVVRIIYLEKEKEEVDTHRLQSTPSF